MSEPVARQRHPVVVGPAGGLVVTGLSKSFGGHRVLQDVALSVLPQSITAVLGPSGCGKTTMLRIIAGFEVADAGVVSLAGRTLLGPGTFVAPQHRRIGLLPQEGALFPHLTVAANVGFGLPRADRSTAIEQWLDLVGLKGSGSAQPHELSGGMQQRVALARALAAGPDLILLDEPFSSLDAALRVRVREEIAWVLRDAGTTAVLVTHDQAEALSLADTVVLLLDGRVAQVGSPAEMYHRPTSLAAAEFIGEIVTVTGTARHQVVSCPLGRLACRLPVPDGPVVVALRPEQMVLRAEDGTAYPFDPGSAGPAGSTVSGPVSIEVADFRYYGPDTVVRGLLPTGESIDVRVSGYRPFRRGASIPISVCGDVLAYPGPDTGR